MSDLLHRAIWDNDIAELQRLIKLIKDGHVDNMTLDDWSCRGDTPLHLAIKLGFVEAIYLLLDAGASCTTLNAQESSILAEAARLGQRAVLEKIVRAHYKQVSQQLLDGPLNYLRSLGDIHMQIEIKLKSPVPSLASLCPQETVELWKRGDKLRIDWTIQKCVGMNIKRGKMSFIASISDGNIQAAIVSHNQKVYESIAPDPSQSIIHDMVEQLMRDGVIKDEVPLGQFSWERVKNSLGQSKTKKLYQSGLETEVFQIDNLGMKQHFCTPIAQRYLEQCTFNCREVAPSSSKLTSQRGAVESLEFLEAISELDLNDNQRLSVDMQIDDKELHKIDVHFKSKVNKILGRHQRSFSVASSLYPQVSMFPKDELVVGHSHIGDFEPQKSTATKERYFSGSGNGDIGRDCYYSTATFVKNQPVTVYMCRNFPLDIQKLLPLIEFCTQDNFSSKELRDYAAKIGNGFSVRVEFPIMAMLDLKISVIKVQSEFSGEISFQVPKEYQSAEILPLLVLDL